MFSKLVLVAALAASAVSAEMALPGSFHLKREVQHQARQTDSAAAPSGTSGGAGAGADPTCQAAALSLITSIPEPDAQLASYLSAHSATDPCSYSVPSSLSSDWNGYLSSLDSWGTSSSSAIYSLLSACPQYSSVTNAVPLCSALASSASAKSSSSSAQSSGSSASEASKSASSSSTASASSAKASASGSGASGREAGVVGAVLAGVLGVAAAL